MSERLHHSPEHKTEHIDTSVESQKNLERINEAAEKAEKDPLQKHVESLAKSAETQAVSGKEFNVGDKTTESSGQSFGIGKELKADAYKRTLRKVQSNLNAPQRAFSRVIHQPAVDAVSNIAAKTVARPSGFLGGSIVAFLGSALLLYLAKYYGYTYNFVVMFILFVGGFMLGTVLELLLRFIFRRKAQN